MHDDGGLYFQIVLLVVVFSTWRQMADSPPRRGQNTPQNPLQKPAHAVPLASARRQHLDVTNFIHSLLFLFLWSLTSAPPRGRARPRPCARGAIKHFTHGPHGDTHPSLLPLHLYP